VIGAHIQIKGGLATGGLVYTDAVSAGAVQVFVGNPRGWRLTPGDPKQDALFTAGCAERGVPSFIHTPFLVNVGSPTEATVEQSIASIAHNLARGTLLGCQGVVVHAGSAVGDDRYEDALRQLHERLLPVLDVLPDHAPRLLIEPTAGPIPYGSNVKIQVSAGVPQVKVPDVTGKKTSDAKKILEQAGLKVEATDWFGDKVLRQNPKAGTVVDVGTPVKILASFF
jgi:hypothetical protein